MTRSSLEKKYDELLFTVRRSGWHHRAREWFFDRAHCCAMVLVVLLGWGTVAALLVELPAPWTWVRLVAACLMAFGGALGLGFARFARRHGSVAGRFLMLEKDVLSARSSLTPEAVDKLQSRLLDIRSVAGVVGVVLALGLVAWPTVSVEAAGDGGHFQRAARWWVDFGDDSGAYAWDGECDDPRFEGAGVGWILMLDDRGRDATDCRRLYESGRVRLSGVDLVAGRVVFGDDGGLWARDGECDDPRFEGSGADNVLLLEDRGRDATDCRQLYESGRVRLFGVYAYPSR